MALSARSSSAGQLADFASPRLPFPPPSLQTPAQNKAILRRIDWFLLPLMLILQTTQYLGTSHLRFLTRNPS